MLIKEIREPNFVILTLNRPEKRNALSLELIKELQAAVRVAEKEHRVLILRGEGKVFCSGMDLKEAADVDQAEVLGNAIAQLFETLHHSPLITIAAVHGAVLAGGVGLMSVCDLAIADPDTFFGFPESKRGLVPAQVIAYLINQIRLRDLQELLYLGENIDAQRAKEVGLIQRIIPKKNHLDEATKVAHLIMEGAPVATKLTKELLRELQPPLMTTALHFHHLARQSPEAQERINSFLR